MDYEVLLLSRVREEYEQTCDNTRAVARSLESTGRMITGAAAIMASVLFAFGLSDLTVIKAMGIGMGIAVVMDATIVRALLVPATMRLLGRWNWWAPGPMARLYRLCPFGRAGDIVPLVTYRWNSEIIQKNCIKALKRGMGQHIHVHIILTDLPGLRPRTWL